MKRREALRSLLSEGDFAALEQMAGEHGGKTANGLMAFLSESDEKIKWAAVKALGLVTARLFSRDPELARKVVRQLIWNLNEESGGIGWGQPEAMGEILAVVPDLREEYACLLVSYISQEGCFLENEALQKGVIWGLGRLRYLDAPLKTRALPFLLQALNNPDPAMQAAAAWTLGEMEVWPAGPYLQALQPKNLMIKIFNGQVFQEKPLKQWVDEALAKIVRQGDDHDRK
jgi:hypothetical protein